MVGDNEQGIKVKVVAGNPFSIGYVSIGNAEYDIGKGVPIRMLPLDAVAASRETVAAGLYAPPSIAVVYRRLLELFGGVPSVLFGLWGLVVLVPLIAQLSPPGASVLAAVLVLTLLVLPTTTLIAVTSLRSVPLELLYGARALGFSRSSTIVRVIIPATQMLRLILPMAMPGILVGTLLGLSRAMAETVALVFTSGYVDRMPSRMRC